jgi:hypothetical protein
VTGSPAKFEVTAALDREGKTGGKEIPIGCAAHGIVARAARVMVGADFPDR